MQTILIAVAVVILALAAIAVLGAMLYSALYRKVPQGKALVVSTTNKVVVTFTAGTPPTYLITVRWDEPTPDGSVPQYQINVPVNPF